MGYGPEAQNPGQNTDLARWKGHKGKVPGKGTIRSHIYPGYTSHYFVNFVLSSESFEILRLPFAVAPYALTSTSGTRHP